MNTSVPGSPSHSLPQTRVAREQGCCWPPQTISSDGLFSAMKWEFPFTTVPLQPPSWSHVMPDVRPRTTQARDTESERDKMVTFLIYMSCVDISLMSLSLSFLIHRMGITMAPMDLFCSEGSWECASTKCLLAQWLGQRKCPRKSSCCSSAGSLINALLPRNLKITVLGKQIFQ